ELLEIPDVGPVVARRSVDFFAQEANRELGAALRKAGVAPPEQEVLQSVQLPMEGQTWVVTGSLESMDRKEATTRLQTLGAKVAGSVSARTTCVVAGPGAGSKLGKAEELGVEVIDEAAFLVLL